MNNDAPQANVFLNLQHNFILTAPKRGASNMGKEKERERLREGKKEREK